MTGRGKFRKLGMQVNLLLLCGLAGVFAGLTQAGPAAAEPVLRTSSADAAKHQVFAHYMVCYATYGENLEGYQREIREAQAASIDGFALNVGAWSKEPHYPRRVRLIFEAAQKLGTDFRLFFSVDLSNVPDILDMVKTYGRHPNHLMHEGRIVVSTFSQEGLAWKEQVLLPLQRDGWNIFFVPYFYPRPQVTELPDYRVVTNLLRQHAQTVDGLFYFGAAGTATQLASANTAYCQALKEAGKLCMGSYTPVYWGARQKPGRRYFETEGGEGTARQWQALIAAQPEWVEIVTWNDFNEGTYVCPVDNPAKYFSELREPVRHGHAGYLELSKYFISWYKTGHPPRLAQDMLFYFYRTHRKSAVSVSNDAPVLHRIGDPQDVLFITTLLTAPAELRVHSGTQEARHPLPPGLHHLRVPFASGPQQFEVWRQGQRLIAAEGEPIADQIQVYNYFPTSGFASSPAGATP